MYLRNIVGNYLKESILLEGIKSGRSSAYIGNNLEARLMERNVRRATETLLSWKYQNSLPTAHFTGRVRNRHLKAILELANQKKETITKL